MLISNDYHIRVNNLPSGRISLEMVFKKSGNIQFYGEFDNLQGIESKVKEIDRDLILENRWFTERIVSNEKILRCTFDELPEKLGNLKKNVVLLTQNGDSTITKIGDTILLSEINSGKIHLTIDKLPEYVKFWYSPYMNIKSDDRFRSIPMGVWWDDYTADQALSLPEVSRDKLLYVNMSTRSNLFRVKLFRYFSMQDWVTVKYPPYDVSERTFHKAVSEYHKDLKKYKYVLCPEGYNVDSCRPWESLYLGAIPIVQKSEMTLQWKDLPILIVDDMMTVTPEFLEDNYAGILVKFGNRDFLR